MYANFGLLQLDGTLTTQTLSQSNGHDCKKEYKTVVLVRFYTHNIWLQFLLHYNVNSLILNIYII